MEKITYKPLIAHLKQSGDQYNQLYEEQEMRFGTLSPAVVYSWIVKVLEPIVAATAHDEILAGKIFQILYKRLLPLLGNQLAVTYEQEYQSAWMMLKKNPHLMQTSPLRVLEALNSALLSIRRYQPAHVSEWITLMDQTIADYKTVEDFLIAGRVYAWLCGMAHLRDQALRDSTLLSADLISLIEKRSGHTLDLLRQRRWMPFDKPAFAGTAGGFSGLQGTFTTLPMVALIENQIIASDHENTCALFADSLGSVLLTEIPIRAGDVKNQADQKAWTIFRSQFGGEVIPYDDVSSAVIKDHTIVFTRRSSFHLFIYGWHV
ncbi:MAG: hypothetical protein ACOYXT_00445 [Bacteroidota bacterium]